MNIPGNGTSDIYSSEAKIMQYNCEILPLRGMGTSSRRNDFWDHLGRKCLFMIG